ncbi:MAG TPA: alcohol dehydrogenase catalytic domain-containing protein [Fimbriimonadaceae bacterium]|nr:alcohol dehydrogenase catalytic domain-containing protein [Fimbriimonadaceae bacterium]
MKVARYVGNGKVSIVDESIPKCPPGGLLIKTQACGLCSGELMDWYMDRKIPHVLGHEVAGLVVESESTGYQVGDRIFAHHHAPCMQCDMCRSQRYVQCPQWKRTRLQPGGMAEFFAVDRENLTDTFKVGEMRPQDAALIEPLACVIKSIRRGFGEELALPSDGNGCLVIGLGSLGIMHALLLLGCAAIDLSPERVEYARSLGIDAKRSSDSPATRIFVCPGSTEALAVAVEMAAPDATIVLFAPAPPDRPYEIPQDAYFKDLKIVHSYSCGPSETTEAHRILAQGAVDAKQVVSDFIGINQIPRAYEQMKRGAILKAMVLFEE